MNDRDLQLVHAVSTVIEVDDGASIYLLNTKYTNLVRVNLVLLKVFLDEKHKRGLMITIDRPHQYLSHLMQLHGIDQSNLTFIDAISVHSADTKGGAVAPELQSGPFHIETLPDFLARKDSGGSGVAVDLSKVEFVIIDNVSTLMTYNTMDSIKRFLQKYVEIVKATKPVGLQTAIAMDKQQHPDLFQLIAELSRKSIELGSDMLMKNISVAGVSVPVPQQAAGQAAQGVGEAGQGILRNKEVM